MKNNYKIYPALIISGLLLSACGGGGSSSSKTPGGSDDTGGDNGGTQQTGVFLDSPVAGIGYRTETLSGTTNALGEYKYLPGETVRFHIGDLELPPVPAKGVVTPRDIAKGDKTTETNILQLLQSLDDDDDPSNGIRILENASTAFVGVSLDLTDAAFDTEVGTRLAQLGKSLVTEEAANKHFEHTLRAQLLGSWLYSEGAGKRNVLTFIDDKHYIIIHEHADEPEEDDSQKAGTVEFGTYTWDTRSGDFSVSLIGESDGWGGLYDEGSTFISAKLDTNTLTLTEVDAPPVSFSRVVSTSNPLVGAWALYEEEDDNLNVLTFLSSSEYVLAHTNNQESYGGVSQPLSGEFGTYSLNGSEFKVTGASVDTDGEGGLYNRENPSDQEGESIHIQPWGGLAFTDDNEGTYSFWRVGSFTANLQDLDASGSLGTISAIRDASGFSESALVDGRYNLKVDFADGDNSSFELAFKAAGAGSLSETGEDFSTNMEWFIDTTGAIVVTFADSDENFTMTIAKILGAQEGEAPKVLLSLQSDGGENSLWETRFEPVSDL